jgi:hypothetical protein
MQVDANALEEHTESIISFEDVGSLFFQNIGIFLQVHRAL